MKELYKTRYLQGFSLLVIFLAVVRLAFVDSPREPAASEEAESEPVTELAEVVAPVPEEVGEEPEAVVAEVGEVVKDTPPAAQVTPPAEVGSSRFYNADGTLARHRIYSVASYATAFPDTNALQLIYARRYGTTPVADRAEAEVRKADLVYIGSNPYYHVAPLGQSIPYLVPRAAMLLQDIGHAFYDSLQIKGIPLHQIVVSSVLRSDADVARLRRRNPNATENSCHRFGTTFDISYVRYKTVEAPDGPARRQVSNDSLKWVLSEVLNDMRNQGRCLIKYERKQPCFHITVR